MALNVLDRRFTGSYELAVENQTLEEEWWVIADRDNYLADEVVDELSLGTILETTHPRKSFLMAQNFAVEQDQDAPQLWMVTVTWERIQTSELENTSREIDIDPVDRTVITKYQNRNRLESPEKDVLNRRFFTTAGVPFENPPKFFMADVYLQCTRYERGLTSEVVDNRNNSMNSAVFYQWPAKTVLCQIPDVELTWINGDWYAKVTYEFIYRRNGWDAIVPNLGYMELVDSTDNPGSKVLRRIKVDDPNAEEGNQLVDTPDPYPLDENGVKLPVGYDPDTDIIDLEFQGYNELDFNTFNLRLATFYPGFFIGAA